MRGREQGGGKPEEPAALMVELEHRHKNILEEHFIDFTQPAHFLQVVDENVFWERFEAKLGDSVSPEGCGLLAQRLRT